MRLTPKGGASLFPPPTGVVCNMMPIIVGQHETIPEEFRGYALRIISAQYACFGCRHFKDKNVPAAKISKLACTCCS